MPGISHMIPDGLTGLVDGDELVFQVTDARHQGHDDDLAFNLPGHHVLGWHEDSIQAYLRHQDVSYAFMIQQSQAGAATIR